MSVSKKEQQPKLQISTHSFFWTPEWQGCGGAVVCAPVLSRNCPLKITEKVLSRILSWCEEYHRSAVYFLSLPSWTRFGKEKKLPSDLWKIVDTHWLQRTCSFCSHQFWTTIDGDLTLISASQRWNRRKQQPSEQVWHKIGKIFFLTPVCDPSHNSFCLHTHTPNPVVCHLDFWTKPQGNRIVPQEARVNSWWQFFNRLALMFSWILDGLLCLLNKWFKQQRW